jgi:hypothetical protein
MRYFIGLVCVLALSVMGCSEAAGTGGSGGSAGSAGTGGAAGSSGTAGSGGSEPVPAGLWTGSGQGGADGAYTICFQVHPDGNALERPAYPTPECGASSIDVDFPDCGGTFATTHPVPIVDGAFLVQFDNDGAISEVSGTIDGDTASGEATVQAAGDATCSGSWMATPSP